MAGQTYRFEFRPSVALVAAEKTLQVALGAIEGLHGQAEVRLDASYRVDEPSRAIDVDAATLVGAELVRVFTSLLIREFGDDAFVVRQIDSSPAPAIGAP